MGRSERDVEVASEDGQLTLTSRARAVYITHMLVVMLLGSLYIACSAGMISFNKYLMGKDKFPFPVYLVLLHTMAGSVFAACLRFAMPSLFTSLAGPQEKRIDLTFSFLTKRVMPITFLQVIYLVLSNSAYMHSSVSFLQMMKEANVILVFLLSVMASLETFSYLKIRILLLVLLATSMTIKGELNFSWTGFALQGSSQGFESLRIVLQSLLLSTGRKLDPFSYTLITMPFCCIMMSILAGANQHVHYFGTPTWTDLHNWAPILALNAVLAFSLNVVVSLFMARTSATSMILAGLIKDAVIVGSGFVLFSDSLSSLQIGGFAIQLLSVCVWSAIKMFPDEFNEGFYVGCWRLAMKAQGYEHVKGSISSTRT